MDLKPTTNPRRRAAGGFTLAEFLVGMSVGLLVLAAAGALWVFSGETFASILHYVDLTNASKNSLDRISQQVRNASALTGLTSNELAVLNPDGQPVRFRYDPARKTLVEMAGGRSATLLSGCESLRFSGYLRTPQEGSFQLVPTAETSLCKVVQMEWVCSRVLVGARRNTERQVSARITLRNQ